MGDFSCSLSAETNALHNHNVWPTELFRTHIGPEHPSDSRDHTKRLIGSHIRAAELLQEVHAVASLGYHVAMLVRSEQQQDYIFTERHLDLMIPVNNSNASCLQEIGQVGPRLLAHEVALSIQGATTDKELLFVRRLRAELPELSGLALSQDAVSLAWCGRRGRGGTYGTGWNGGHFAERWNQNMGGSEGNIDHDGA